MAGYQILLSDLRSCTAYTYFVQLVGIFLKIVEPPMYQVSIDFLIKYCVLSGIAGVLKKFQKQNTILLLVVLPPDQLQQAVEFLTKDPPSHRIQIVPGLHSSKNVRRTCSSEPDPLGNST